MSGLSKLILPIVLALACVAPAEGQVVKHGDCVVDVEIFLLPQCALETRGGHLYVSKEYLPLFFSSEKSGLASAAFPQGGWAYFDLRGLVVVQHVATFDNGASPFHHGLVRVFYNNKWGLANVQGSLVVPLKYDGMLEYEEPNKGWRACAGCRNVSDGEHGWFEGGEWYWLDTRGRVAGKAQDPRAPDKSPKT